MNDFIDVYGFTISEAKSHYKENVDKFISNYGLHANTQNFGGNVMYSIEFNSAENKAKFAKDFEIEFPFLLK